MKDDPAGRMCSNDGSMSSAGIFEGELFTHDRPDGSVLKKRVDGGVRIVEVCRRHVPQCCPAHVRLVDHQCSGAYFHGSAASDNHDPAVPGEDRGVLRQVPVCCHLDDQVHSTSAGQGVCLREVVQCTVIQRVVGTQLQGQFPAPW